jgi:hypothetical protein
MDVHTVTFEEVRRKGLRGLRGLSGDELRVLHKRFGVGKIDQIGETVETAPSEFKPEVGAIIGGKYRVLRFAGNFEGEAQYEVTKIEDESDEEPVVFTRSVSRLYAESLNTPPSAAEIRAMNAMQYAAAVKKFGEKRIQKVLDAAAPKPLSADERESVIVQALNDHWQHAVVNHRGVEAVSARLEGRTTLNPADVDNAIRDAISAGEVPVDLRVLGLADRYQFDVCDSYVAIQHLNGEDFARVTSRFHKPAKHWADDMSASEFKAQLDANDDAAGITPVPPMILAAEQQVIGLFKATHPEVEFENQKGSEMVVDFVRGARLPIRTQYLEWALGELVKAKEIAIAPPNRDASDTFHYHGTTLQLGSRK